MFYNLLWIKPTDALNSKFIGITILHVSGSLSAHHQEFLDVHKLWYILCSYDNSLLPGAGWNCISILLLVANGHHNCILTHCRLKLHVTHCRLKLHVTHCRLKLRGTPCRMKILVTHCRLKLHGVAPQKISWLVLTSSAFYEMWRNHFVCAMSILQLPFFLTTLLLLSERDLVYLRRCFYFLTLT
jgi:hypothetical protein